MNLLFTGLFSLFWLILLVLEIVAYWRIFTKAGQAGWKSLIPVYSQYVSFKIAWRTVFFWLTLIVGFAMSLIGSYLDSTNVVGMWHTIQWLLSVVLFVIHCIYCIKLSKSFGKGVGFGIGLILLNFIFVLILGLGDSEYIGPDQP